MPTLEEALQRRIEAELDRLGVRMVKAPEPRPAPPPERLSGPPWKPAYPGEAPPF